jgi:sugar/nucleoside kinase (ribokinase family)
MAKSSLCIGSGLVCLDVILNGKPNSSSILTAGGSCGNVLAILAFMGWTSAPVARLADDKASEFLIKDLNEFNVNTDYLTQSSDGSTPIIIHRILKDKTGSPRHKFEFKDPDDGVWLPRYKPVLATKIAELTFKKPSAFYFDRINRGTIDLARKCKEQNAVIIFEPSSIGEIRLFKESLAVADIVKFSKERIPEYEEIFNEQQATLEIATLGEHGCEFRFGKTKRAAKWDRLPGYKTVSGHVIDAGGAGDWCSAAIINELACDGQTGFSACLKKDVVTALNKGQAFGALNCCFNGARGIMYKIDKAKANMLVNNIIRDEQEKFNQLFFDSSNFRKEKKAKISIGSLYR